MKERYALAMWLKFFRHLLVRDLWRQPIATETLRRPDKEVSVQLGCMFVYASEIMPVTNLLQQCKKWNWDVQIIKGLHSQFMCV